MTVLQLLARIFQDIETTEDLSKIVFIKQNTDKPNTDIEIEFYQDSLIITNDLEG